MLKIFTSSDGFQDAIKKANDFGNLNSLNPVQFHIEKNELEITLIVLYKH